MFVFAFEGALLAFIVNGDRFVLFALLPRRKPRTSRDSAAALSFQRTQPHQRRLLRFACAIWSLAWISCIVTVAPLPYINPSKSLLGFTVKNFRVEPPDGGIGFAAGRSPIGPRVFVVALRAPLFLISIPIYDNRCRSRRTRTRPRARRKRTTSTETGTR